MKNRKLIAFAKKIYKKRLVQRLERWFNHARYLYRKPYIRILSAMSIEGRGVFLRGWLLAPKGTVSKIKLNIPGQASRDITGSLVWQQDDRLSRRFGMLKHRLKPRFVGLLEADSLDFDKTVAASICFELHSGRRVTRKLAIQSTRQTPLLSVERLLESLPARSPDKRQLFNQVYGPVIKGIWANRSVSECSAEKVVYNESLACSAPAVSIVIPIYGRYDFIEYQLSEFVNDPDMLKHDIVYVIDDPALVAEVRQSAEVLARMYRISFSIVYLSHNLGYAGANNRGVDFARASKLLLLNSDIMPASNGWLSALVDSVGEDIDHVVTGARLLYEDNSIQHNGMSFYASPFVNDLWTNVHPAKGLPNDVVEITGSAFECDAVTGACILLTRDNFIAMGGFDENYILGDYEDSDLCMKARQFGLRICLDDRTVLYHLERQSQTLVTNNRWKDQVTYYNCWLHTQKWDNDIRKIKNQHLASKSTAAPFSD